MLKKSLLASALALLLAGNVFAQDEAAEEAAAPYKFSANIALTSDYVFRGVSQTQEDPALQAGLNFEHESGFYAGIWGSSVDFVDENAPAADEDGANVEIDAILGYAFDINDDWAADISAVQYFYPGTNDGIDYDYLEFIGAVTWNDFITGKVGYSLDVFNSDETGVWIGLSASHDLPWWGLSINGEVGNYDIDGGNDDGSNFSYMNYGLGLSKSFGPLTTSIGWSDTDKDGDNYYGKIAGSRVFLTLDLATDL